MAVQLCPSTPGLPVITGVDHVTDCWALASNIEELLKHFRYIYSFISFLEQSYKRVE
jgi:hypothetical protein